MLHKAMQILAKLAFTNPLAGFDEGLYPLFRIKNVETGQYYKSGDPRSEMSWTKKNLFGKQKPGRVFTSKKDVNACVRTWPKNMDVTDIRIMTIVAVEVGELPEPYQRRWDLPEMIPVPGGHDEAREARDYEEEEE